MPTNPVIPVDRGRGRWLHTGQICFSCVGRVGLYDCVVGFGCYFVAIVRT